MRKSAQLVLKNSRCFLDDFIFITMFFLESRHGFWPFGGGIDCVD